MGGVITLAEENHDKLEDIDFENDIGDVDRPSAGPEGFKPPKNYYFDYQDSGHHGHGKNLLSWFVHKIKSKKHKKHRTS